MERLGVTDATRLDALFSSASAVAVISHTHPDGDAAGSCVAMKSFLDGFYGSRTTIILDNAASEAVSFILDGQDVLYFDTEAAKASDAIREAGLIVCLDVSSPSRTGKAEELIRASKAPKVLFDHHLNPEAAAFDMVVSSCEVSSTCEILYKSLKAMPVIHGDFNLLPETCRTALMTGLTTDTNNFANSVYPDTFAMTSELLSSGVDRDGILMHIYNEYRENRLRLIGRLLSQEMTITKDGVAYIVLSGELGRQYDIRDGELEGMVNMPLGIKSVRMSIFVREDEGFLRVSIRSKRGTSANAIAVRHFNGGGHELASGGKLFIGKDIASSGDAAAYIERVTSEFFK